MNQIAATSANSTHAESRWMTENLPALFGPRIQNDDTAATAIAATQSQPRRLCNAVPFGVTSWRTPSTTAGSTAARWIAIGRVNSRVMAIGGMLSVST